MNEHYVIYTTEYRPEMEADILIKLRTPYDELNSFMDEEAAKSYIDCNGYVSGGYYILKEYYL